MKYQILKNHGAGYHSRSKAADGFLAVLCDHHVSLEAAKSGCRGRAGSKLTWTLVPATGSWPAMWEGTA
jgi:hypothetical protein